MNNFYANHESKFHVKCEQRDTELANDRILRYVYVHITVNVERFAGLHCCSFMYHKSFLMNI